MELNYGEIETIIGYTFKNKMLLQQAFMRRSYAVEHNCSDNEVLEFIGDKALDLAVVKYLAERNGDIVRGRGDYYCDYSEATLTEMKRQLVERRTLAESIENLGLNDYLIMGRGDIKNRVNEKESVKEDLFEAIIGAVALDCNWDIKDIESVMEMMLDPESVLSDEEPNYVQVVQEWCENKFERFPKYDYQRWSSFDKRSAFYCSLTLWGMYEYYIHGYYGNFHGYGPSKAAARRNACKKAYDYLDQNDLLFTIRDEIANPNRTEAIGQLETLARRGYFSIPTYEFSQGYDDDGNPIWAAECHISEYEDYFFAEDSSKKEAKKTAAFEMLKYVLDD